MECSQRDHSSAGSGEALPMSPLLGSNTEGSCGGRVILERAVVEVLLLREVEYFTQRKTSYDARQDVLPQWFALCHPMQRTAAAAPATLSRLFQQPSAPLQLHDQTMADQAAEVAAIGWWRSSSGARAGSTNNHTIVEDHVVAPSHQHSVTTRRSTEQRYPPRKRLHK